MSFQLAQYAPGLCCGKQSYSRASQSTTSPSNDEQLHGTLAASGTWSEAKIDILVLGFAAEFVRVCLPSELASGGKILGRRSHRTEWLCEINPEAES